MNKAKTVRKARRGSREEERKLASKQVTESKNPAHRHSERQ